MQPYNHEKIENNWREHWFKDNIYKAVDFSKKPKKYILAELPYPSGKSLHVGHMMRYTVPEIYSRFLRMRGYNVLFPMGWDSFGLPAETYALKEGITPQVAIARAAVDYKKAMQGMGYAIDWDREINTSDPDYYKWTQWTFIKLWEKGLAELKEMPVWWCKELGVLADEEVLPSPDGDGKISERGGHLVERKMFKQWVLKIPDMADRLIEDLDTVDYYDSVKQAQLNWIGRKEGTNVIFDVGGLELTTFTTRPDTIFGITFLAVSPEHKFIEDLIKMAKNREEVVQYVKTSKDLSDMERQTKEKTGVELEGVYAKHPFSEVKDQIPVFIADYILVDYGTGVVQGVPAHDDRDNEFAQKYDLEIKTVVEIPEGEKEPYVGHGKIVNSYEYDGKNSTDFAEIVTKRLSKEGKGGPAKTYRLRPQVFSRQRYWGEPIPLIYKEDGSVEAIPNDQLPLELPEIKEFWSDDGSSPLEKVPEWVETTDSDGKPAKRETDTMPTWAGSNWYYMRYIDPKNDKAPADMKKLKYWMPVDQYFGTAAHTTAHLLYSRFWYKFLYDEGIVPHPEPYQWRMSGGLLLGPDGKVMSKSRGNVVHPQDVLDNYGADAIRTYLCFIGPYEDTYPWNPNGLVACARLVKNIYEMQDKVEKGFEDIETQKKLHVLIKKATKMMENLKMNTTVSEIMIFTNHLKKVEKIPEEVWIDFIKVVAPFMPFTAEELWQNINGNKSWKAENSVHLQDWPKFSEKLARQDEIELPIQVNGRVRAKIIVGLDISEKEAIDLAKKDPNVSDHIKSSEISKVIYVKNRILNLVTK